MRNLLFLLCVSVVSACADSHGALNVPDSGDDESDGGPFDVDSGARVDSGTLLDIGIEVDAEVLPLCSRAMDVQVDPCIVADCVPTGPLVYFWNGYECKPWSACLGCTGEDCDAFMSLDECQARYASCNSVLCEATGGFFRAEHSYCGDFVCGHESPATCFTPTPACDCGLGKIFDPALGCVTSSACSLEDLCIATRGTWRSVSLDSCGNEVPAGPPPRTTCDCGAPFVFSESEGCSAPLIDLCIGPSDEQYCTRTGGTWAEGCGGSCGRSLDCDCIGCMACECGRLEVFDVARGGCVRDESCTVPSRLHEECLGTGFESTCDTGLVCCAAGGASSATRCEAPQCGSAGVCGLPRP